MSDRFERAIAMFDRENARDPNIDHSTGRPIARELLYARWLTDWVLRLDPNASEALRLAARCQHIRRWEVPRSRFPADRAGYHRWRNDLKRFHAEVAGAVLRECGYDEATISRVRELNLKQHFPNDIESRTIEDALCLVFLEHQFHDFAAKTEREKVLNALRKSWGKMTERGRAAALALRFSEADRQLIAAATESP